MAINAVLEGRSGNLCELCGNQGESLKVYTIPPRTDDSIDNQVVLCAACFDRIDAGDYTDTNYWRFLTGSIWSEVPAVQVLSYKILGKISFEEWAAEAMESASLDESVITRANAEDALEAERVIHKDSYGVVLEGGDTVILTQNLNVKGTSFTAPKGTIVRKIRLVPDNAEQIEGKINGETIVILTKYVRKSA